MRFGIGAFFGGPFWRQQEAVSKLFSLFQSLPPCSLLPRRSSPFQRSAKTKSGPQIRGRALKPWRSAKTKSGPQIRGRALKP